MLLYILSDAEERKDLARSAEAASARMILLPRATKPDYAITLGRTDGLSRRWNSRPAFSHPPTARGIGLASISGEVKLILTEPKPCRGLNPVTSRMAIQELFVNVLCDVWLRLTLALLQQVRSALRTTFFPRTWTRPLSSRQPIQVIHGETTLGHNRVLKVFNVGL